MAKCTQGCVTRSVQRGCMMERVYQVGGMSCAACAMSVETAANKLGVVDKASVNLLTQKLVVAWDGADATMLDEQVMRAVRGAGFLIEVHKEGHTVEGVHKRQKVKMCVVFGFAVPLLLFAMLPMLAGLPHNLDPMHNPKWGGAVQFVLVMPVMVACWGVFAKGVVRLCKGSPNMDSLIALGVLSAFVYSLVGLVLVYARGVHFEFYFETAGLILAFSTLGKFLESRAKGKASQAVKKLIGLVPNQALVEREGVLQEIGMEYIVVGDVLVCKAGGKFAVDGVVLEGYASVDESALSGESMPVHKTVGDQVVGASINLDGVIKYKATKVGKDTVLNQIIRLVEDAQSKKAPIARIADKVCKWFVPAILLIASIALVAWMVAEDGAFAIKIFIAVLVMACPCALGLATPTAMMVGTGKGAERGVIIKSGEALERLGSVSQVVFDKTGTLTKGTPQVTDVQVVVESECKQANGDTIKEILRLAMSVESGSSHPIAKAIIAHAQDCGVVASEISAFESLAGKGVRAKCEGKTVFVGSSRLAKEVAPCWEPCLPQAIDALESLGKTVVVVVCEGVVLGLIGVADETKQGG
ncbi:MAG: heavy metal translocating P-type ATPase, partial [Firmicutes bacterium]|nr:heavy metal translocating P-type ATPase [Bacillota bacterium]